MKSAISLFVLLSLSLFTRATAQDEQFILSLFDHPPHGVYARTRGLHISARLDDHHSTDVSEKIRAFVETVAPGKDVMIAYDAPRGIAPSPFMELTVESVPLGKGLISCMVVYIESKPAPAVIDIAVRKAVELGHAMAPQSEVLGMALLGDDKLSEPDFSGDLVYDPKASRIMSMDEHSGTKTGQTDKEGYSLIVKEEQPIVEGDKRRAIINVKLIFPRQPSAAEARRHMLAETLKLRARDVDIITAPYVGPKEGPWEQMKDEADSFGRYLLLEYTGATDTLTEHGKKLSVK